MFQLSKCLWAPCRREPIRVRDTVLVLLQAAILVKDDSWVIRNLVLRDVIPLSLGIGLEDGGMKRIVERNTRIPCQHQGGTKTCVDNQTSVLFEASGVSHIATFPSTPIHRRVHKKRLYLKSWSATGHSTERSKT